MHFGEYELSPSLISLSPLRTTHPGTFQRLLVRPSIPCYRNFSLVMRRSLGFASTPSNYAPCSDSLSLRFQALNSKCFSPFPHGTGSLSVSREYLALPDGPGSFTQNSSCSALLRIPLPIIFLLVRGFHPLRPDFPDRFQFKYFSDSVVLQPQQRRNVTGLGSSAFARHYLRNHNCFLFLRVLRCFSSPRSPHH